MSKEKESSSKVSMQSDIKPDQKKDQQTKEDSKKDNNNFDRKRSTEDHGVSPKEYTKGSDIDNQKSQGL